MSEGSATATATPPPRRAATVVLVRAAVRAGVTADGGPYEVYLVHRPKRAGFMPDSHVFPGGKVDKSDADVALGCDPDAAAAVREAFEECGILLAVDAGGRSPDTAAPRFVEHRRRLRLGETTLAQVLSAEGLRVDVVHLRPWAHWITPSGEPVRFSARFFVARVPPGQVASHAEGELVDELWDEPAAVLRREASGELRLPPPTYFTVYELAALPTLAELDRAAARRTIVSVMPKFLERDGSVMILLPWDSEYAAAPGEALPVFAGFDPPPWSRHVLEGGRWWRRGGG